MLSFYQSSPLGVWVIIPAIDNFVIAAIALGRVLRWIKY